MRLAVLPVLCITAACGPRVAPLAHACHSPEALAAAVLEALAARDATALRRLALSEGEFRDRVWPHLPVARPERTMPLAYVWGDLRQKSEAWLAATLAEAGGKRWTLVRVRFAGGTTDYGPYRVHRRSVLTVRETNGFQRDVRLFGSVLEQQGQFKVFSFVVD